uniref:Pentatricopeptide repeat-containing protein n=1 Tax=Heterorhabditis bacteriophora TaxID=37862 RepID=A0A1I7WFY6_HETBA
MFDIVRSMPEQKVIESEQCTHLANKAKLPPSPDSLYSRLTMAMSALSELEGGSMEVDRVMMLSKGQIDKQVFSTIV